VSGYTAAAMNNIVFGRGNTACGTPTTNVGMCNFVAGLTAAQVKVVYTQPAPPGGLGYAGRSGGPAPLITVSLQNVPFQFFFLKGLLGFGNFQIAPSATITAEDLCSTGNPGPNGSGC
jgi:hypothetical protein